MRPLPPLLTIGAVVLLAGCDVVTDSPSEPTAQLARVDVGDKTSVDLGRLVFFDDRLSIHGNQSCAACHTPEFGFGGPLTGVNQQGSVYRGSFRFRAGNRRPPTAAYAAQSPVLHLDPAEGIWLGGNFWNGRATGEVLGNPAADQALGPFVNPVEQALPDEACVPWMVRVGPYASVYLAVWGGELWDIDFPPDRDMRRVCSREGSQVPLSPEDRALATTAYRNVATSVKDFELSPEVSAFSSKYDAYLAGGAELTADELAGLELFEGKAMCSACHISEGWGALFTDYSFDNIGVPPNPLNPVYESDPGFVDLGLGGFLGDPQLYGAQKVPTLRNATKAPGNAPKSFMHNGVFKSLEQVVHFYNTRDALRRCEPGEVAATPAGLRNMGYTPACWPAPEVEENVNIDELGDLGLTAEEERLLVEFMRTLNDGWVR